MSADSYFPLLTFPTSARLDKKVSSVILLTYKKPPAQRIKIQKTIGKKVEKQGLLSYLMYEPAHRPQEKNDKLSGYATQTIRRNITATK